jgi:hypothetical protein
MSSKCEVFQFVEYLPSTFNRGCEYRILPGWLEEFFERQVCVHVEI